jgi:hypothetical protein
VWRDDRRAPVEFLRLLQGRGPSPVYDEAVFGHCPFRHGLKIDRRMHAPLSVMKLFHDYQLIRRYNQPGADFQANTRVVR